jgi:2,4-dienoyl-CoA reductase-like NADH-dependent reductase (Old Yellow Enzyme family)
MRIERNKIMLAIADVEVQALESVADVRAEMVARGKALIADPNYPSKEQLRGVARVLARQWAGESRLETMGQRGMRPDATVSCCE